MNSTACWFAERINNIDLDSVKFCNAISGFRKCHFRYKTGEEDSFLVNSEEVPFINISVALAKGFQKKSSEVSDEKKEDNEKKSEDKNKKKEKDSEEVKRKKREMSSSGASSSSSYSNSHDLSDDSNPRYTVDSTGYASYHTRYITDENGIEWDPCWNR